MSIQAALSLLLQEYSRARAQAFAKNAMAEMLRTGIPREIETVVNNPQRYEVNGSPGKGNWADVPWVAILDRLVTETAQQGYYLVYLVREDCSGVYLSLNQGVTTVREQYGVSAKKALATRAQDLAARLGSLIEGLLVGPIDLSVKKGLGVDYQQGSVCAKFYPKDELPNEDLLISDLRRFIKIYRYLVDNEESLYLRADAEEDEVGLEIENLKRIRKHKRIERNRRLADKAKKVHGYICQACGFNFEQAYGELGVNFIEAHHLVPISELSGDVVALDPRRDFRVLCSNCHRMIHKSEFASRVQDFKEKYVVRR